MASPCDKRRRWRLFEENYRLLNLLLPDLLHPASTRLNLFQGSLSVRSSALGPYTSELELQMPLARAGHLPPPLYLKLRLYHDACLAEVVAYQNCKRVPPAYAARQSEGFQRDDRWQVNRLLYELLLHCHRHQAAAASSR